MRLIDAEKLIALSEFYEASIDRKSVETAPTIEAIPISWIKTYVLSTGKPFLLFNAMINEWRRINGQQ